MVLKGPEVVVGLGLLDGDGAAIAIDGLADGGGAGVAMHAAARPDSSRVTAAPVAFIRTS